MVEGMMPYDKCAEGCSFFFESLQAEEGTDRKEGAYLGTYIIPYLPTKEPAPALSMALLLQESESRARARELWE